MNTRVLLLKSYHLAKLEAKAEDIDEFSELVGRRNEIEREVIEGYEELMGIINDFNGLMGLIHDSAKYRCVELPSAMYGLWNRAIAILEREKENER